MITSRRQLSYGALIGATFGLVFVVANARTPLGSVAATAFRVAAVAAFVILVATLRPSAIRATETRSKPNFVPHLFGRRYVEVVSVEVVLLAIGLVPCSSWLHRSR